MFRLSKISSLKPFVRLNCGIVGMFSVSPLISILGPWIFETISACLFFFQSSIFDMSMLTENDCK